MFRQTCGKRGAAGTERIALFLPWGPPRDSRGSLLPVWKQDTSRNLARWMWPGPAALLPFRPPQPLGYSTSAGSPSSVLLALSSHRGKAGVSPIIGTEGASQAFCGCTFLRVQVFNPWVQVFYSWVQVFPCGCKFSTCTCLRQDEILSPQETRWRSRRHKRQDAISSPQETRWRSCRHKRHRHLILS